MLGSLIAALGLLLAPPVQEAPSFDAIVDIASPATPPASVVPEPPAIDPETDPEIELGPPPIIVVPPPSLPPVGPAKPWGGRWRRWGAPVLSLFVPGLGQLANGEVLKGLALFYTGIASLTGAVVLYTNSNDGSRPIGREYARLIGYGLLSSAVPMIWRFAVADAYRVAIGKIVVRPHLEHRVRFSLARTMVVGFRADPDRPGFYDDWSVAALGQVARRLSVGASDLTLKFEDGRIGVVQFGGRIDYRVFDRGRLWIDLAIGTAMQVAIRHDRPPLDPEAVRHRAQARFGAVPYAQLDFRWFVLDRVSFDLVPRLSVPVTTRYFSAGRALPRFAPTLEIGLSGSLYF